MLKEYGLKQKIWQTEKYEQRKHGELSSIPWTHIKILDVVDDAWILSAVETEISSNTLISRLQANERISLKRYVKFLRI